MKYTKEQLQAMSDFEVNKALAKLVCKTHVTYSNGRGGIVCVDNEKVDYCNTPNDIMPLAFEHGIGLTQPMLTHQSKWQANWFSDGRNYGVADHYISDENQLRAIACCLILVLQGEKE